VAHSELTFPLRQARLGYDCISARGATHGLIGQRPTGDMLWICSEGIESKKGFVMTRAIQHRNCG
jgi:hypothetical protein